MFRRNAPIGLKSRQSACEPHPRLGIITNVNDLERSAAEHKSLDRSNYSPLESFPARIARLFESVPCSSILPCMRFAVIGNPVAHSLSPAMHTAAYAAIGLDHEYTAILVENLDQQFNDLQTLTGINVTIPHKEAILTFCEPDEFARRAGSVNTVDFCTRKGINTDGPGFLDVLPDQAQRILILGAGGTARALALALEGKDLTIWNRTEARAQQILKDLDIRGRVSSTPDLHGYDVIVNATATGLSGERLPLDWGRADTGTVAIELAYGKAPTRFEQDAASAGLKTIDGRELLIAQGARSFHWWLGIDAPIEAMRAAVYGQGEA